MWVWKETEDQWTYRTSGKSRWVEKKNKEQSPGSQWLAVKKKALSQTRRFPNTPPTNSPLSSVVERVTRNDEVGCSIQPAGIRYFCSHIQLVLCLRFPNNLNYQYFRGGSDRMGEKKRFGILYKFQSIYERTTTRGRKRNRQDT